MQEPTVRNWLGDVVPVWTLLDRANLKTLDLHPFTAASPIHLATDLTPEETNQSAIARNALILLRAAAEGPGLKLTATGNLTRSVVAEMIDLFTWPEFDKEDAFRFDKVINEPDFVPLFLVRQFLEASDLLRAEKGYFRATDEGQRVLEQPGQKTLQAVLFYQALWRCDLADLSRGLHRGWLKQDAGLVLWSLSITGNDWETPERLTRLCTMPTPDMLGKAWDTPCFAMEAQMLRPLQWFGLVAHQEEPTSESPLTNTHSYRKTALFDRFLAFDIGLETSGGSRH